VAVAMAVAVVAEKYVLRTGVGVLQLVPLVVVPLVVVLLLLCC